MIKTLKETDNLKRYEKFMLSALTKKDMFLKFQRIRYYKPIGIQKNILKYMDWS